MEFKVITNKPVIYQDSTSGFDDYSNAKGNKADKKSDASDKPKKAGFFSKEKRAERKEDRKENKAERKEKRSERRAKRKAQYGARPLKGMIKNGVTKFKDTFPGLRRKVSSNGVEVFEKVLPDGQIKELAKSAVKAIPSEKAGGETTYYDLADVNTNKEVLKTVNSDGSVSLHKEYDESETEKVPDENGVESVYKKEDVKDDDGTSGKGMSKGMKIGLAVGGGLLLLTIIGVVIYKMSNKSKKV